MGSQNVRFGSFYFECKHITSRNTRVSYWHTISLLFGVIITSVTAIIALVVPRVDNASCRHLTSIFKFGKSLPKSR